MTPDVTTTFLRWFGMRAALHRGYWLVTSLYLVVDAELSAFQLVFLGTAQGIISLIVEVPAGVVADTVSRRLSLVIAHVLIGASMVATGLVTAFPALVATQMLWGVGWSFASGADVAWVTDELRRPERIARVLTARARWDELGSGAGLLGLGLLALLIGRSTTMVIAGAAMVALGGYVVLRFSEHGFVPARSRRWRQSTLIFRRGLTLARHDREILVVLLATVLINGAAEAFGRLYPKQLVQLGFPSQTEPILWFTGLGVGALALGALALWIIEARIDGVGAARRIYALACFIGVFGLLALAWAPGYVVGYAGVLLVGGIALSVTRAVGIIWVNRRTSSDVRATMQSILAQAEYSGEIACGLLLGAFAQLTSISLALVCAAVLMAYTGLMVLRSRTDGR